MEVYILRFTRFDIIASVAQLVERLVSMRVKGGSNPPGGNTFLHFRFFKTATESCRINKIASQDLKDLSVNLGA